jgi:hypothetical protein
MGTPGAAPQSVVRRARQQVGGDEVARQFARRRGPPRQERRVALRDDPSAGCANQLRAGRRCGKRAAAGNGVMIRTRARVRTAGAPARTPRAPLAQPRHCSGSAQRRRGELQRRVYDVVHCRWVFVLESREQGCALVNSNIYTTAQAYIQMHKYTRNQIKRGICSCTIRDPPSQELEMLARSPRSVDHDGKKILSESTLREDATLAHLLAPNVRRRLGEAAEQRNLLCLQVAARLNNADACTRRSV